MGSKVDRGIKAVATGGISEVDKAGVFKTGRSAAEKAQKAQKKEIAAQRQKDELELAENEDALARRKAGARSGGRSMLITPQAAQGAGNLGGTV
ncbi:MAG: hypothetical protein P8J14_06510 [Emcibacteraceae bacterium]|nr:hypothetical protein [Emcibacteraceae bacterium]